MESQFSEQPAYKYLSANTASLEVAPEIEYFALKEAVSSVPAVSSSELLHDYQDLGFALAEMKDLDEGDEWKIDPPVYDAACNIALVLMTNSYPAPEILHHGPKSVVFNWANGDADNLYLTISSDRMSALISSPERIKRRIDFTMTALAEPLRAIRSLEADYRDHSVMYIMSPASDSATSNR
jgi:hypothetical protein